MAVVKECNCCHEVKEHAGSKSTTCNDCLAIGLKWCSMCEAVKPIEDFYKNGFVTKGRCKECESKCSVQWKVNNNYLDRPGVRERKRIQSAACQRRCYATEEGRQKELMRCHNRRTKVKGTITLDEWKETLEYFDNSCAYCGSTDKITQDHIVPISEGGLTTKHNLVPACPFCNSSKSNRPLIQWYMKQPFATEERLQKVLDFMKKEDEDNVIVINYS